MECCGAGEKALAPARNNVNAPTVYFIFVVSIYCVDFRSTGMEIGHDDIRKRRM